MPRKIELQETIDDLQEGLDYVQGILEDVWFVAATRKELAEAIGEALMVLDPEKYHDVPKPHDGEPDEDD